MKLMRVGAPGAEKPAIQAADGTIRDLSAPMSPTSAVQVISVRRGSSQDRRDRYRIRCPSWTLPIPASAPASAGTGKFICIGLNYSDHAAETGATVPPEPIIFMKATSAIIGPNDNVQIPRGSEKTDWEVELAVIIGKTAKVRVSEDEALDYVAGYAVSDDVSERAFQTERSGQWTKGKSCDTFGPIRPMAGDQGRGSRPAEPQVCG